MVELNVRWKKAFVLEPDWKIEDGHVIEVQGRPTVRTTLQFLPPPDFQATTLADFMVLGHIMTAMPAVNAIPSVVAARPGIVTYADGRETGGWLMTWLANKGTREWSSTLLRPGWQMLPIMQRMTRPVTPSDG